MPQEEGHSWLRDILRRHERLTPVIVSLVENALKTNGIDYLGVVGRTKELQSARKKIERKSYDHPQTDLTDLSGIRVVTYFDSQVRQTTDVLRRLFVVDEANSLDKKLALGIDRVGYRSFHLVCSLGASRASLPEYEGLAELKFEVQVRTVLQHAWAELTHDRSYKFGQALPADIERRLNLHAGNLELTDAAFDEISKEIDTYVQRLKDSPPTEVLPEPINSLSVQQFIRNLKGSAGIPSSLRASPGGERLTRAVREAERYGLTSIRDLQDMVTEDFVRDYKSSKISEGPVGFLRSLMLYSDMERYLSKADRSWNGMEYDDAEFLARKYGSDTVEETLRRHEIRVEGPDNDPAPDDEEEDRAV